YETRVRLRPTVPSDAIAQERAAHWRRQLSPATVLLFHKAEGGGELEFLTKVAHSIDGCLCPCILSDTTPEGITSEPSCRLLVLSEASLAQTPALQAALKEGQPSRIGPNPVLILPAIHQYFEHPELKASLWTSLCHLLEGKS
ncbi:MAG: hypothetical protein KDK78_11760, partial [Chlamydiia bacterium]|nr:hypothetical protein [Chlamydiia bacterium]